MREKDKLYDLLAKELESNLTSEEKELLNNGLQNNKLLKEQFQAMRHFWFQFYPENLSHKIIEQTEKKLKFTYQNNHPKNNHFVYKIAVGILLLVSLGLSGFLFLKKENQPTLNEYQCKTNEVRQIELSDGTKVWLNSGSSIITLEPFTGETRNVKLYGEAYFEVAPDAKMPFVVETQNLNTKVLGTEFNISSWPNSKIQEIELYEGKVRLEPQEGSQNDVFLTPGKRAHFNTENGVIVISENDGENQAAWRNGILNFYNEELNQIASVLERKYNTQILITCSKAGNLRYTAEFKTESLEKVLLLLSEAKKFEYHISEQGVIIGSVK